MHDIYPWKSYDAATNSTRPTRVTTRTAARTAARAEMLSDDVLLLQRLKAPRFMEAEIRFMDWLRLSSYPLFVTCSMSAEIKEVIVAKTELCL